MTDASGLMIQRQNEKDESLAVSPGAAELAVVFTRDQHQVLTNVPTRSTPFSFGVCRAIPGNEPVVRDTLPYSIDPRHRDRDDRTTWQFRFAIVGFNLARDRQPSPRCRGHTTREVAGNVRIDLRFVVCRCIRSWRHRRHSSISGMAYRLSSEAPASH